MNNLASSSKVVVW